MVIFHYNTSVQITIACCCAIILTSFASQQTQQLTLHFIPHCNGKKFLLNNKSVFLQYKNDSITLTQFKYYISNIALLQDEKLIWKDTNSYFLLDAALPQSLLIKRSVPNQYIQQASQIVFNVGIDSLTNIKGALGGALDVSNGMYWAWHSGYINMKIEGTSPKCNTRKNEFQYHLGGFRAGENCEQQVVLKLNNNAILPIGVNVANFFEQINLSAQPQIMTPGATAVKFSQISKSMFAVMPQ
jgi:hypothetical protein